MFAVVYGTKRCNFCTLVVNALEKEGATVEKKDVSEPNNLIEMREAAGENARTVPQVVIDGKYIGGYTEVDRYLRSLVPVEKKPEIHRG
jgi:glutaredoxin